MNQLPELCDIIDTIQINKKDEQKFFADIRECIHILIGEYIQDNIGLYKLKKFENIVLENIYDYFLELYPYDLINIDILYIIEEVMHTYFILNNNPRSYPNTCIIKKNNKEKNKKILESHLSKEQPEQRTKEWYEFRHNRLTASDFYKVFDTEASGNNLILKKCSPIDISKYNRVNTESACHHGHKFEPLSIMIYESRYNTKVGEYGCISHDKYDFLGASPDGINIDESNERYCRLVEVKNPKSRIPDGIPKKEYWVQMQLQMEVWNLDECDFLETTFDIYESEEEFKKDGTFSLSNDCKEKGVIIQYFDGKEPIYEYAPLNIDENEFNKWYDESMEKNKNLTWVTNIYWKLNIYSCILVPRNKKWFKSKIPKITEFWNIILKERVTGYEHRKPKKRAPRKKPTESKEQTIVIKINTPKFDASTPNLSVQTEMPTLEL
jgi:putative phage-type endonuclease